jgi:predicted phage tail protein
MSLSLAFVLLGVALIAGSSVSFRGSPAVSVRSISAAAFAVGCVLLLIGLVNVLSGTA